MPAQYPLTTYTISFAQTTQIQVVTYYQESWLGDIIQCFINQDWQIINNMPIPQGHLIAFGGPNFQLTTDINIENNGDLLVFAESLDEANKYSIDSNGYLIYTTDI